MVSNRISGIIMPHKGSGRIAFWGAGMALIALAAVDLALGNDYRLHSLYLLPFTVIAIHCEKDSTVAFGAAATFGLQTFVLFSYAMPLGTKVVSSLVSLVTVCLTGILARSMRRTLLDSHHDANHDPLTGLSNRRSFCGFLEAEIARQHRYGSQFSLAMIDLDHFKALNDEQGHEAGDAALTLMAEVLRKSLRETDIAARMGGDEFAVLMPNCAAGECDRACSAIVANTAREMTAAGFPVTATVGCASFAQAPRDTPSALKAADRALYAAKALGRNRYVVQ